ncbi:glutamate racemase [Enterococcus florum]|uniref:Glutamate racemase n=1 Tax=Enterococcus florum TaxID=2480627 RepID=A0A4P5P6S3_9ENTE|nr:glutamate racemase [Enterococcus florum]GCF93635.1 glutamate racemase [Enterococcus florum]
MSNECPIGFIDSGVGGLTVVKEAMRQLPNENILYVGDTARCPYGPRPAEQVIEFTRQMTQFLIKKGIKMLVIACNTATAVALEEIRKTVSIPVIGVIQPGARSALKASTAGEIAVIGTTGTIKSGSYERELHRKAPEVTVYSLACPKFATVVESNQYKSAVAKKVVAETLKPLLLDKPDTLILGCTHYPLLRPIIQNVMGKDTVLIDSGAETVNDVSTMLDYFDLNNFERNEKKTCRFYTTGSPKMFQEIASEWLSFTTLQVEHIHLGGE